MPLDPEPVLGEKYLGQVPRVPSPTPRRRHPVLSACYAIIALAAGLTLIVAPWVDTWNFNYLQGLSPTLEYVWDEPSFRGALTALGCLNILIGLRELARLLRNQPSSGV